MNLSTFKKGMMPETNGLLFIPPLLFDELVARQFAVIFLLP
jgi:hypothetical protein